ncbi:MAG: ExbD/TolR family protein [Pseudomonadota bacterium]
MISDAPIRRRSRPMAEINVVPYIDVMLVLLIIFMITAPMLNLGVEVELPQGQAETLGEIEQPLFISVTRDGELYLNTGDAAELVDPATLVMHVTAIVNRNPEVQVIIGGDREADFQYIYEATTLLQQAGVASIGFMGELPE